MIGLLLSRFAAIGAGVLPTTPILYVGGATSGFVGDVATGTVDLTALTGGMDTRPRADDLVVVAYAIGSFERTPVPTITGNLRGAYDDLTGTIYSNGSNETTLVLFAKRMDGSPDTSLTRGATGNVSDAGAITVAVFRNVDVTYADVAETTAQNNGGGGQPNPPSITPVTPGAIVLAAGSTNPWNAGSDLGDFTSADLPDFLQVLATDSQPSRVGMGWAIWPGGPFNPVTWGGGNTASGTSWAAATMAIRPPAINYVGGKAVGFAGDTSSGTISLTDLTGGLDTQPSEGDYVVVAYTIGTDGRTPTLSATGDSSGAYGTLAGPLQANDTNDSRLYVFAQRMGTTPDIEITRSATGNVADAGAIAVHVWRGVDPTTPMDVTRTTSTGIDGANPTAPAITPATAGAVVLMIVAGTSNAVFTAPFNGTVRDAVSLDTDNAAITMSSRRWVSGAVPATSHGGGDGTTSNSWTAVTLALRPEA